MKFSDLKNFRHDESGNIVMEDLVDALPNTPQDVIEQFYVDHGRNCMFQEQYRDIEISCLELELRCLSFNEISDVSIYDRFRGRVDACMKKSKSAIDKNDFMIIGYNQTVVAHWITSKTWLRSPLMLQVGSHYHLIEGHSRYGCLKGMVSSGYIPDSLKHEVWVAKNV